MIVCEDTTDAREKIYVDPDFVTAVKQVVRQKKEVALVYTYGGAVFAVSDEGRLKSLQIIAWKENAV